MAFRAGQRDPCTRDVARFSIFKVSIAPSCFNSFPSDISTFSRTHDFFMYIFLECIILMVLHPHAQFIVSDYWITHVNRFMSFLSKSLGILHT